MPEKDYYAILGLDSSASIDVIKAVYRALAKKYHPDTFKGDKKKGERLFKLINEAYGILSDDNKRREYDNSRVRSQRNASDYEYSDYDDETEEDKFYDRDLEEDWKIAVNVYPEIEDRRLELHSLNNNLAISYVNHILQTKDFRNARIISRRFSDKFLSTYFTKNHYLKECGRALIVGGYKNVALKLNKTLKVIGTPTENNLVIRNLLREYNLRFDYDRRKVFVLKNQNDKNTDKKENSNNQKFNDDISESSMMPWVLVSLIMLIIIAAVVSSQI